MTRTVPRTRPGFVLPLVMALMVAASLVIAAVVGYVSTAARFTRSAVGRDRCRLAAQSAIEQAKLDIQEGFDNYISASFSSIKIAPRKARAYNWFDTVSADRRTVGSTKPATIFTAGSSGAALPMPIEVHGCRVWVGIGDNLEHEPDAAEAVVPIVATAELTMPGGTVARTTICEWIVFGTEQSKVFDNAYFVNNYGWMSGPFLINGEFRANGNVSLSGGCGVNGFIYAAPNSEIGARGTVSLGSATIYDQTKYRTVNNRARYDTGNLDEIGSYDPASATATIAAARYDSNGRLTGGSMTAGSDPKAIVNQTQTIAGETSTVSPVPMPFVSELDPYVEYAQDEGGTLSYPSVTYNDGTGSSHTVPGATINAHRTISEAGPSGSTAYADAGSVLLVGTQTNPIRINGPVVVDGDVIIKGYVSGQGTIYAGRNVHIIGDIKYVNAPTWTHSKTGTAATQEQTANEGKDMLGLVAKGNIVVGDCTSSSCAYYVNSGDDIAYACDESDSIIGYPSRSYASSSSGNTFNGDYTAVEQISNLPTSLANAAPGRYRSGKFGKVRSTTERYTETEYYQAWNSKKRQYETKSRTVTKTRTVLGNSYDRRFYETICDNAIINALRSTVYQIDAVMYNNHGVFGALGSNFKINGALICRDEGLTASGGSFNWDMRLRRKKGSEVVSAMGLPKGPGEPYTCRWMELPDSVNPVYRAARGISE